MSDINLYLTAQDDCVDILLFDGVIDAQLEEEGWSRSEGWNLDTGNLKVQVRHWPLLSLFGIFSEHRQKTHQWLARQPLLRLDLSSGYGSGRQVGNKYRLGQCNTHADL